MMNISTSKVSTNKFLPKLFYFIAKTLKKKSNLKLSEGHVLTEKEQRKWEKKYYTTRWQYDKVVRSTHGVNCTGSCSWRIYVKNGMIVWELQATDYPRTRHDLPNHEPRGCQRGASYSWYVYSSARIKYPLVRSKLIEAWRKAKEKFNDPVRAYEYIITNKEITDSYKKARGRGGFVRTNWNEINELIAASNVYTVKEIGPDRIAGFSPIPAMSMISYAAGSRYLSLIGGVCLSFYDWYCDLPPSSPQTWGEQTDVPESADWYNSTFIMTWGSNVPQTRTPDAHFLTEVRYKGTKVVAVTPDYSEVAKFADIWLHPKQGTDAALAVSMCHVIIKEFYIDKKTEYFTEYCKRYTDMPFVVVLKETSNGLVPGRFLRASDLSNQFENCNNAEWKPLVFDEKTNSFCAPNGTIGFRWCEKGLWNLKDEGINHDLDKVQVSFALSFIDSKDAVKEVAYPYFGNATHPYFQSTSHEGILLRNVPVKSVETKNGKIYVTTVFDLLVGHYGVDRGLGGKNVASSYQEDVPYTPAWQEKITGVEAERVITVAKEFALNAAKTQGKSMIILGAGLNHWYHMDMSYRGIMSMLMLCGCVGQSGGGWAHYVGQEKLRPQAGWLPLAFGLDWHRPSRQMNGTSFFYYHSAQWRYEQLKMSDLISPLEENKDWLNMSFVDCNAKAERMGWLPSAPQLNCNPLKIADLAQKANKDPIEYTVDSLKNGNIKFAHENPDDPNNCPRVMFVWRSNLLGASGKGHEYFIKHLIGSDNAVNSEDLYASEKLNLKYVHGEKSPYNGKLDLLITLDFRMSTTCLYSDIVLPTASWYEKDDINTSDMHPFIHPLSAAIDPVWETRSDWEIYKGIAKTFSKLTSNNLDIKKDVVLTPLMHDTAFEITQSYVKDWKLGECDPIPGKTMPNITVIERDYPNTYKKYTALGPLMSKIGNVCKGISWDTKQEVEDLLHLNGPVEAEGITKGMPKIETAIDAVETILMLAPETNGHVAVKSWKSLGNTTGIEHVHLAIGREEDKIRFRDIQAQPRKIISSPIWSGLESEKVSYNAGYTNVHELIPWRTLTGRQQFYQDHEWMLAFGEGFCTYKPPVRLNTTEKMMQEHGQGYKQVVLNFITPHQKWGIHSTYNDNLIMLTLNRGGPVIWISEVDAVKADIVDNDWIEAYNANGTIVARAVVSQRVPEGMVLMYHAQEKNINVPLSEISGKRGGLHNSVTRVSIKPTHMIGGYAQYSYGLNYYGTVGFNRDEFVIVRKMKNIKWY